MIRITSLLLISGIVVSLQATEPPEGGNDALSVIEGVRGGRHWVDEKTADPKSPADSMKCLQVEPGFELTLVAAEPLVMDPVAIAFDSLGQMYAVEYGDYPIGPPDGGQPLSRVVLLRDEDGDGQVDRRTVFADNLDFAHSLMAYRDGILVGAKTQLIYLLDRNGDGKADHREVLFDGFTPAHPQMQIGNPRWGMDNWVYCNYGPGKITTPGGSGEPVSMPRKDFRFHPKTMEFQADGGLGQFGNTVDRWGNRFYCTNRNPIMTTLFTPEVASRNRYSLISKTHYDVGRSGGQTRVYPLVAMKSNYLSHAGTHTSACGVTANLGDQLGADCRSSVLVCEPIGHLVTRSVVQRQGATLVAHRAREKADFIASTDTWFRPSSLATGPDGAMYLADMYRLWVEHPKFLPKEIADRLDWRAGEDRGRIYRIQRTGAKKASAFKYPATTQDCVALLDSDNGWRQFLGHRLLVERGDATGASQLRALLRESPLETARLHALWVLDGTGTLDAEDISIGLRDASPHVRSAAVRLGEKFWSDKAVSSQLLSMAGDDDALVRFQLLISLGGRVDSGVTELIGSIASTDGASSQFADVILSTAQQRSGHLLSRLANKSNHSADDTIAWSNLITRLATVSAARGDVEELASVLGTLRPQHSPGLWWNAAVVNGLGKGLPRHRGDLGSINLARLISRPPKALAANVPLIEKLLNENEAIVLDGARSITDRVSAAELLSYKPFDQITQTLAKLLSSDQPAQMQTAAIAALSANGSEQAAKIIIDRWGQLGAPQRAPALTMLLRRASSTKLALEAMQAGRMTSSGLGIDQRVRLLKHSDAQIRTLARKLLGGAVSENRRGVAQQYAACLKMEASVQLGQAVFKRVCANCHKLNGQGHETGPDLSDVRNRSKLALLYDILDPNAKVEPRFSAYSVLTLDGRVLTGLMSADSEDAIVLSMAEGKQQTIDRVDIEEIKVSDVSLMPEGVEKDISVEEMAHLLEYLKNPAGAK